MLHKTNINQTISNHNGISFTNNVTIVINPDIKLDQKPTSFFTDFCCFSPKSNTPIPCCILHIFINNFISDDNNYNN